MPEEEKKNEPMVDIDTSGPEVEVNLEEETKQEEPKETIKVEETEPKQEIEVKEETKGGIIIAQETLDRARVATQVGYVLKMGDLCYKDEEKFSTGPWCKEKDWVIFARYAGSRMEIDGGEIRMLNDDEVLGTISNPEDILHAM